MKQSGWMTLMFAALILGQISCEKMAPTNSGAPTAVASPTKEVVDTVAIETELMRIENDWPRVLKEKDAAAVRRVEADDLIAIYPDGSTGDKSQDVKDMESGALTADSWELSDLKVKVIDADAAVTSGRSVVKNGKYKMPDGKTIDISGEYRFVDTFARRNGQWQLVASATTPVRQPSGTMSPAAKSSPTTAAAPTPKMSPTPRMSPAPTRTP